MRGQENGDLQRKQAALEFRPAQRDLLRQSGARRPDRSDSVEQAPTTNRIVLAITVFLLTAYPPLASVVLKSVEASRQPLDIGSLPGPAHASHTHVSSILGAKAVDVALAHFAGDAFYYFAVAHRSDRHAVLHV